MVCILWIKFEMLRYLAGILLLLQFLLDIGVTAQSYPLFSQNSYSFTVYSCSAGTYIGQVSASGATSYSTDNSFVITVNPSTGALSLGASIAASTTFNVIARNQYGSTQAPVTVNANCGGGSSVITNTVAAPAVSYATLTSPVYAVNTGIPTTVIDYNISPLYSTNNVFPYNSFYNTWDRPRVSRNGNGNCIGNTACWYGGSGPSRRNAWGLGWTGYGSQDIIYASGGYGGISNYGGYNGGLTVQCFNGYCYNNAG